MGSKIVVEEETLRSALGVVESEVEEVGKSAKYLNDLVEQEERHSGLMFYKAARERLQTGFVEPLSKIANIIDNDIKPDVKRFLDNFNAEAEESIRF